MWKETDAVKRRVKFLLEWEMRWYAGDGRTNFAALCVFVPQGAVIWKVGLLVGASNLVGGYVGARTAVSRGTGFVRVIFVVVVGAFVLKIGADVARQLLG